MSGQRRIAVAALVVVAVLAGGWFKLVAPKRAETSAVQAQIAQAETRRAAAVAALANAERIRATLRRDTAAVARLGRAVPDDDDVGALIRQLDAIARANKIDFRAAKLVGTTAAAPAAPAAAPAGEPAKGDKAADEPADAKPAEGAGTADPGTPVAATVAQPPPGAVVGPAGLLTVPFSFTFDGGYLAMQRFLGAIDDLAKNDNGRITVRGRLITVDGFSLSAGRAGFPKVKALVSATAYLATEGPATTAAAPGAAAGATTPASAPTTPGTEGAGG